MRIQKRPVFISMGILLFSSSVVAQGQMQQGGYTQQPQGIQGYYDAEQPPMSEEPPPPEQVEYEEPAAYPSIDDDKPGTFGVLVGYAIDFETLPFKPYQFALGVRGGYTLDLGIYLGVKLVYYTGEMQYTNHMNYITTDVEIGYDIDADMVIVRPSIDFGFEARNEFFHLGPGASVLFPFEEHYFAGLDIRYQIVFDADPRQGVSFLANGGVRY